MKKDSLELVTRIAAPVPEVFDAWFDPAQHARFTGAEATGALRADERYTAWEGYIEGTYLEIDPHRRVLMTWRTTDFSETDADSRVEVRLTAHPEGGTELRLVHTEIPAGQGARYERGWDEFYFAPLAQYFALPAGERAG